MLQLTVKIFANAPGNWILQVTSTPPNLQRPYFFQKDGFQSSDAAKNFLIANMRLFALNMGEV